MEHSQYVKQFVSLPPYNDNEGRPRICTIAYQIAAHDIDHPRLYRRHDRWIHLRHAVIIFQRHIDDLRRAVAMLLKTIGDGGIDAGAIHRYAAERSRCV